MTAFTPPLSSRRGRTVARVRTSQRQGKVDARREIGGSCFHWPFIVEFRAGLDRGLEHFPQVELAAQRELSAVSEKSEECVVLGTAGSQLASDGEVRVRKPTGP